MKKTIAEIEVDVDRAIQSASMGYRAWALDYMIDMDSINNDMAENEIPAVFAEAMMGRLVREIQQVTTGTDLQKLLADHKAAVAAATPKPH